MYVFTIPGASLR